MTERNTHGAGDALAIAREIMARGWKPVPVPVGKAPKLKDWQRLEITTANVPQYFNGAKLNVGAQMGPVSGGLTDTDLDCAEAVALASYFLPHTDAVYGRAGKRRSHFLYTCDDPDPKASIKLLDENKKCVVELRLGGGGKGAQSVMPGSVHPSGELYEWDEEGAPAPATCADLKAAIVKIAVATLLVRHWPAGSRHEAALRVGGFLARCGWEPDAIGAFMVAVQRVTGVSDPAHVENGRKAAWDAATAHRADGKGYGLPALGEFFGEAVARQIAKLLAYDGGADRENAQGFETTGDGGRPKGKSQHNIRKALALLGVTVRYDTFNDQMMVTGLEGHTLLDDPAVEKLWLLIDERYKFLPDKEFFFTVVKEAARRNSFNPVLDYIDGLKWDGHPRIDNWLTTYGKAEDTPYVRAVGKIMLVAAVRRIRQPGCKFDEIPIFESPQGEEKSTALATLAGPPDWFSDDLPLNLDGKKTIEHLRGRWIIEAADLSGMRRADVEHLKAFLSRQVDRARLVWDRTTTSRPRQCIIVGTTNETVVYLKDLTGNRRFWPIKCGRFDIDALKRDRDQLWAEAAAREAAGDSIRLDAKLWAVAAAEQQERTVEEPWIDQLAGVLGDMKGKLSAIDAWNVIGLDAGHRTQDHNARFGRALRAIGFKRTLLRFDGKPAHGYVRGNVKSDKLERILVARDRTKVWAGYSTEDIQAKAKAEADRIPL